MATAARWRQMAVLGCVALLGVAAVGSGPVTLSPEQLYQLASGGGALAVLGLVVVAFLKDWVVTRATANQRVEDAAKMYEAQAAELRRQRDEYRDMALRGQGSQQVQASAVRELADAVSHAIAAQAQPGTP